MRDPLTPYNGPDVLNYLCIIATELLSQNTLQAIPALGSGFKAVLDTLPAGPAKALQNLRLAGRAPGTVRELRLMVDRYRAYHQRAIRNGFCQSMKFLGSLQHMGRIHRRNRAFKSDLIRIHDAQRLEAEIGHGAGRGADVEWIAGVYQHDSQAI